MKHLYFLVGIFLLPLQAIASGSVIHIYQDADISNNPESAEAIQKGIELAFDEINNQIDGFKFEFKYLDHRGNVIRSKQNYQKFIDDPNALAIYSGIHSPPLIKNRAFINENKALTLVPWAAGGPITRFPSPENWVFRLSIDDTQAGPVIINFALNEQGCKKPHLLLEETPWGDSNLKSMSKALSLQNVTSASTTRFSWNLKSIGARAIMRDILDQGSDCIVLVANTGEGAVIVNEMAKRPMDEQLPIISHWGIASGNFTEVVTSQAREGIDLHFIQTCFAFTNENQSQFAQQVFANLKIYSNGAIEQPSDIKPVVGFTHAYDLTRLLIQAIRQAGLTGDNTKDRNAVRLALENIKQPVEGLLKTYNTPFSVFNEETNINAHEALQSDHYCMGKYESNDEIVILAK